jgi:hypothetical protein
MFPEPVSVAMVIREVTLSHLRTLMMPSSSAKAGPDLNAERDQTRDDRGLAPRSQRCSAGHWGCITTGDLAVRRKLTPALTGRRQHAALCRGRWRLRSCRRASLRAITHSTQERGRSTNEKLTRVTLRSDWVGPTKSRRVAAGRVNARTRVEFTENGFTQIGEEGPFTPPWRDSTGPRTVVGKVRSSANGRGGKSGRGRGAS